MSWGRMQLNDFVSRLSNIELNFNLTHLAFQEILIIFILFYLTLFYLIIVDNSKLIQITWWKNCAKPAFEVIALCIFDLEVNLRLSTVGWPPVSWIWPVWVSSPYPMVPFPFSDTCPYGKTFQHCWQSFQARKLSPNYNTFESRWWLNATMMY